MPKASQQKGEKGNQAFKAPLLAILGWRREKEGVGGPSRERKRRHFGGGERWDHVSSYFCLF